LSAVNLTLGIVTIGTSLTPTTNYEQMSFSS